MPVALDDPTIGARPDGQAVPHVVLRYDPDNGVLLPLPNVRCLTISARVGAEPWSARFRYAFDQRLDPAVFPSAFEQVFALSVPGALAGSPFVVRQEDRLIVRALRADGAWEVLFDGFARLPQVDYSPSGEVVTFEAVATVERLWDVPIPGALMRDAPVPDPAIEDALMEGEAFLTSLPARFNPDGKPNATPEGEDFTFLGPGGEQLATAPIFVDPARLAGLSAERLAAVGRHWSLAMAARLLIVGGNAAQFWVLNPDLDALEIALSVVRPSSQWLADSMIDWRDPTTYVLEPVRCPDLDVTGLAWPEALQRLIGPFGFTIAFELETVPAFGGLPRWRLIVRRNDDNTHWKALGLQARGQAFNPALNAVAAASLQREGPHANEVDVDTAIKRVEASFLLAPIGWEPDQADADKEARDRWVRGTEESDPVKYRVFGLDECGEGHYDFRLSAESGGTVFVAADLAPLFPDFDGRRDYVRRRRPGSSRLLARDEEDQPRKAELWFAALDDYEGPVPGVFDREAAEGVEWQQVTQGGWELLPDRLGIVVTAENARAWEVTKDAEKPVVPGKVLDLVRSMADPSDDAPKMPRVVFRLTTVIEWDYGLEALAPRRAASPSRYATRRRLDARDRLASERISPHSHLSEADPEGPGEYPRDDTEDALRLAEAHRRELEGVRFAGSLTVPRLTHAVRPCDKVIGLFGRDLVLSGYQPGTDEGPRFPMVVGIEWSLDLPQTTRLMLADRRAEFGRDPRGRDALD